MNIYYLAMLERRTVCKMCMPIRKVFANQLQVCLITIKVAILLIKNTLGVKKVQSEVACKQAGVTKSFLFLSKYNQELIICRG